jgi:tetratricopeptide (TPR) repeat protein
VAIENDPLNATAWFWRGNNYAKLGFADRAIQNVSRCIELDPAYFNCYRHLARDYLMAGNEKKALDTYLVNLEQGISQNDFWMVPVLLDADRDHAAALLLLRESGGDPSYPVKELLQALENPEGDYSEGIAKLEQWIRNDGSDSKWRSAEWVALGAYDRVEPNVDSNRIWTDAYRSFRASEYFKPLVSEMGLPAYWRVHGFPPQCRPVGENDFECD